jgi:DHA3 family tetracycline resistance protein-like MFS transporter
VESNIWKYALIQFTNRRNFIPILSVYFLTLPNTHANQIGIYMGIGYVAAMIMQMPSGYIADHYGQKSALIISKLLLVLSTFFYLIADGFLVFMLGSICMSLALSAFSSGTNASFLK